MEERATEVSGVGENTPRDGKRGESKKVRMVHVRT